MRGYDVTEDGKIAAASWLPKALVHGLRERVLAAGQTTVSGAIPWAIEDIAVLSTLDGLDDCIALWLRGSPAEQIVKCLNGTKGYQDFLSMRDNLVTILRTYTEFARAHGKTSLTKPLIAAARKVQYGVPDDGLPLACMALKSLNRDRLLTLYYRDVKNLEALADLDFGSVTLFGEAGDRSQDAIEEARGRIPKIQEVSGMPTGPGREKRARQLASEFGMDLDDFYEFALRAARN